MARPIILSELIPIRLSDCGANTGAGGQGFGKGNTCASGSGGARKKIWVQNDRVTITSGEHEGKTGTVESTVPQHAGIGTTSSHKEGDSYKCWMDDGSKVDLILRKWSK